MAKIKQKKLTSNLIPWYIKKFAGMNNKVESNELDATYGTVAQNCRFEPEPGSIQKRPLLAYYNPPSQTLGTLPVREIYRYYGSDGTIKLYAIYGNGVYVGNDVSGAFTQVTGPPSTVTAAQRWTTETYQDLGLLSNGQDDIFVVDGEDDVMWELGSCKALLNTSSPGGNLDASATYSYRITMDGDAYICGATSNVVTTDATYQKINLSRIPLGPAGTTNRRIYRTVGGGDVGPWYLIATIADNTTTTYADDIADTTVTPSPAITDDMPKGKYLKIHRERLFIAGDPNLPSRIYYSNPYLPGYIQQTVNADYMDINPNDSDDIQGIPLMLGVMHVIKRNTIRKVHVTSATSGADPALWYAEDPTVFNGAVAPYSITQTSYGIVYLAWDHWYLYNGSQSKPIIDEFDIDDILPSSLSDTICHFNKDILFAAYTDKASATDYHNRVMRYNFKRRTMSYDTISVDCFESFVGDDEPGDTYYGSSIEGHVYKSENVIQWLRYNKKSSFDDVNVNLVTNGIMELWSNGASSVPDDWGLTGAAATIARESTTIKGFDYSAALTRAGTNCYLSQRLDANPTVGTSTLQSKTLTVGAWVYATVASRARISVGDDVGGQTQSSYHTGGSSWELLTVKVTIDGSAEYVEVRLELDTGDTTVYFDNVVLAEEDLEDGGTQYISSYMDNIEIAGTEDRPEMKIGDPRIIDTWGYGDTIADIASSVTTVQMPDVKGIIITSPSNIRAGTLDKLYWNADLFNVGDVIRFYARSGATKFACLAASWGTAMTDASGSDITGSGVAADEWFQVRIDIIANSYAGTPRIYYSDGYTFKYSYYIGGDAAETAIEFIFETGFRNCDYP